MRPFWSSWTVSVGRVLARASLPASVNWAWTQFLAERDRWALWLPVLLGGGIGFYFALPTELSLASGPLLAAGAVLAALIFRRQMAGLTLSLAVISGAIGFALAAWRTADLAAPVLERRLGPVAVIGRVLQAEPREDGLRLTLDRLDIARLAADRTPARIRVTLRRAADPPRAGDEIRLRAVLMPPPEPAAPGAFDFARAAWFQQLGAVGYAVSGIEIRAPAQTDLGLGDRFGLALARLRQDLTARILAALPGATGAVAAALMTGERGAIPADVDVAFRDSGLAHLLSISGLHLALVAGILFVGLRSGLALWEPVALRYPIKKWAAAAALLGTFGYLLLSGSAVPTQRAFVMAALVLVAVMLDRNAISMRSVGWAAVAVLSLAPEALLNAGFQMSFAAVVALIAGYEAAQAHISAWRAGAGWWRRIALYVGGVLFTTLLAGFATAPYAAFHFGRFVDFGLVANLLAVPLTSLWVMPWAVLAFLLMPFGLEGLALAPMGLGVDGVIAVARLVAGWPGAISLVPAMPLWGLLALTVGGLWVCLWWRPWRLAGILAVALGGTSPWLIAPPDILIDGEARLLAVRGADGQLLLSERARGMVAETWLRRNAQADAGIWPREGPSADGSLRCDSNGCIWRRQGYLVALARSEAAADEDCRNADVLIATVPVRGRCSSARVVIDRFDIARGGAYALWLGSDGRVRSESVRGWQGDRPWVRRTHPAPVNTSATGRLADPGS